MGSRDQGFTLLSAAGQTKPPNPVTGAPSTGLLASLRGDSPLCRAVSSRCEHRSGHSAGFSTNGRPAQPL